MKNSLITVRVLDPTFYCCLLLGVQYSLSTGPLDNLIEVSLLLGLFFKPSLNTTKINKPNGYKFLNYLKPFIVGFSFTILIFIFLYILYNFFKKTPSIDLMYDTARFLLNIATKNSTAMTPDGRMYLIASFQNKMSNTSNESFVHGVLSDADTNNMRSLIRTFNSDTPTLLGHVFEEDMHQKRQSLVISAIRYVNNYRHVNIYSSDAAIARKEAMRDLVQEKADSVLNSGSDFFF